MKTLILDAVKHKLEDELQRLHHANTDSNNDANKEARGADKQRNTTFLEASYLAQGYANQCRTLTMQIEQLEDFTIEDFTAQEIDTGALITIDFDSETETYFLLDFAGGIEITMNDQTITVITPESPLGKVLIGNIEAGFINLPNGREGIILDVL